jgi:hypothetical protein
MFSLRLVSLGPVCIGSILLYQSYLLFPGCLLFSTIQLFYTKCDGLQVMECVQFSQNRQDMHYKLGWSVERTRLAVQLFGTIVHIAA